MKVTAGQIYLADKALAKLSGLELPIGLSMTVSRNVEIFRREITPIAEKLNVLYKKHGTEDEKEPGRFTVPKENIDALNKDVEELMAVEIDAPFTTLKASALEAAGVRLAAAETSAILWLIDAEN